LRLRIGRFDFATVSELNIVDADDALTIRASPKRSLPRAAWSAVAGGGCAAIFASSFIAKPGIIALALLAALAAFLYVRRNQNFELRITSAEFVSRGRIGNDFGSTRRVRAQDIDWLEYQENRTGPEDASHPGGLYAVQGSSSICMLPFVDERQTAVIIERIEGKFPDLSKRWKNKSWFGQHFTTLRLNEPT
jgi:hypothetical protein